MTTSLQDFLATCDRLRLLTTDCDNYRMAISTVDTIPEAVTVFRQFWVAVVQQIPQEFISAMLELYPRYRADFNAAGVYFNEAPSDKVNSLVFVGGVDDIPSLTLTSGRMRVIVVTRASLVIGDHIRCVCYSDEAEIVCRDRSLLTLERGTAHVRDNSSVNGSGRIYTYDRSFAKIYGGTLIDCGHSDIHAYGNTQVYSATRRNITLHEQSQIIQP